MMNLKKVSNQELYKKLKELKTTLHNNETIDQKDVFLYKDITAEINRRIKTPFDTMTETYLKRLQQCASKQSKKKLLEMIRQESYFNGFNAKL